MKYFIQRRIVRSLPAPVGSITKRAAHAARFAQTFRDLGPLPLEQSRWFELGAGYDLVVPLALRKEGVSSQVVMDVRPLARRELVDHAARQLGLPTLAAVEPLAAALLQTYGVEYRAPADGRRMDLPSGSVDCITSTNTFEHIPLIVIHEIVAECRRLLRPSGLMVHAIDYKDHYSYSDTRLTPYNFLRFDEREWQRFNPPLHYQNRLRHGDYLRLFEEAGFEIAVAWPVGGDESDLALLESVPLAASYAGRDPRDLAIRNAVVAARRR